MTLDSIIRRVNYQGDDHTTCFSFPFKVWGKEQVVVYCSDPAESWTEEDITCRVTVTLNEDNYGGAVVFTNAPADGALLAVVREGNFLQEDEYISGSRFDAHEIEDRFDEDAAERQELLDATERSIKVPNSSTQTPEEVYEQLLSGAAFVEAAIGTLTELYNQAVYYYNLAMGYFGEATYVQAKDVSFIVSNTHIVNDEGPWLCTLPDGFKYYPATKQLLVTVDGLALTPGTHFDEIGKYGETSNQIRFNLNIYQNQQVYIKAMFLGTEAFSVQLQQMDDKIEAANDALQALIESADKRFEAKIDEVQTIIDGLDGDITRVESLVNEALEITGTATNWQSFQEEITKLTNIYNTFTLNEDPTQGFCLLTSDYSCNTCLCLPSGVCYFKCTNTLHLAIDGLILSPRYFEEIGGTTGANYVKLCNICLYCNQELHAWTETFWGHGDWTPMPALLDITTRLYVTSTSGCIYHSDDLGRNWSSDGAQLPEDVRGQQIIATSNTLWALSSAKVLMCSTDNGLTWGDYSGQNNDNNLNFSTACTTLYLPEHGLYATISDDSSCSNFLWSWDELNWNYGYGFPKNVSLNNVWASEHLPFFVNEPITKLEAMWSEEPDEPNKTTASEHCYFWGPISPSYQLKSDLSFDNNSIPIHITIDKALSSETDNDHGSGATIVIYKSDTYQNLTQDTILLADGSGAESQEERPPQTWCEFARYEVCGPICANTNLYTCVTTAGQNGSGETVWPAGYYAAAIYNVYGDYSSRKSIPNINFCVSRMERYSSNVAKTEPKNGTEGEEASD